MTARTARLGDRVTLHYRLTCAGQEIVDTYSEGPETFTLGSGEIDPRLEICITGLKAGERHIFELAPGHAFGQRDETLVQRLERAEFDTRLDLQPGLTADFALPNGQTLHGTILAVDETHVELDFNHPLAGLPVEFEVELLSIE